MNDKIGQSPLPKCTKEYLLCLELNSEPVCTELFKFLCVCASDQPVRYPDVQNTKAHVVQSNLSIYTGLL